MRSVQPYLAKSFNPSSGLQAIGGFVAFGLSVSALYAATGIGFPCPFRALTGWECPLCGGTRLGAALLHLRPAEAFADNPMVFLALALLPALALIWTVEALGGPALRPPARIAFRLRSIHPTRWLAGVLLLAVGYTLLRHLL